MRLIAITTITFAAAFAGGCSGAMLSTTSQDSQTSAAQSATNDDNLIYHAALNAIALEYRQERNLYRVHNFTMAPCDSTAGFRSLDCSGERDVNTIAKPWANGTFAFAGLISETTRAELAASFEERYSTPKRLRSVDTSRFVLRSGAEIAAEYDAWTTWPHIASIMVSSVGYSADGHAYMHAVYHRNGRNRGDFAVGLIILLKRTGELWEVIKMDGTWVT